MKRLLRDICDIQYGYAFDSNLFSTTKGIPLVRIRDVLRGYSETYTEEAFPEKYIVENGDILIGMDGEFNIARWQGGRAALNQRVCKLIPHANIESRYLFYAMPSQLKAIEEKTPFVTVKHLSAPKLNAIEIQLPSIEQQKAVADCLDAVNHSLDLCNRILAKLDTLVKSRLIEMFGDPVTNPMGWEKKNIGEITDDVKYGTSAKASDNGKYKYLRMNNLTYNGYLDLSDLKQIDISDEEVEKYVVRKGDVLFNRTNSTELVGKTALFDLDEDMIIAGYIIRVRLQESVSPVFFTRLMNLKHMKKQLRAMAKGAVNQANINAQELKSINVYVPPIALQNQFADFVAQTDKLKLTIRRLLEKQELLRAVLMQEYFG